MVIPAAPAAPARSQEAPTALSASAAAPRDAATAVAAPPTIEEIARLRAERDSLIADIIELRETALLQEAGIYRFSHPLDSAAAYKARLESLEKRIDDAIKRGEAVKGAASWAVNGSLKEGAKMVSDFSKLMLRAYNNEADNAVRTMKPYALEAAKKRLEKTRATISKLGVSMQIHVTDVFHALRIEELELTADYLAKVAEEKEREREERARLREEEKVRKELEQQKAKLVKEMTHNETVRDALIAKGDLAGAAAIEATLGEIRSALDGVTQREANVRAGYVYVISNIGSFGDNVVKIGMTRRLEPRDRIRELGDASVPFRFDTHALFFSDDAVGLETMLHRRFADRRVNMVNNHREFFFVTPSEVREALLSSGANVLEFVETPEALEYRQSLPSYGRRSELGGAPASSRQPLDLPPPESVRGPDATEE